MARLRFTIRDILWMTVVVAVAVAIWRDRAWLNAEWEQVRAEEKALVLTWRELKDFVSRTRPLRPKAGPVSYRGP